MAVVMLYPRPLPPLDATKLITPLRSTPPPELSASTAELITIKYDV